MKTSAGILIYRNPKSPEVLLVHLAGPFWSKKDTWSIPKGELDDGEDHLTAARREFKEELGIDPPSGEWLDLGISKQPGKVNYIWAVEGDVELASLNFSHTFTMEWPPRSGQVQEFQENDRAEWFDLTMARRKVFRAQIDFIDRLADYLGVDSNPTPPEPKQTQQSLF